MMNYETTSTLTPILDSFLPVLARGLPTAIKGYVARSVTEPLRAYEISDADADDILCGVHDPGSLLPSGYYDQDAIQRRLVSAVLAHGDLWQGLAADRATLIAYTAKLFVGPPLPAQPTVAMFVPGDIDGKVCIHVAYLAISGKWARTLFRLLVKNGRIGYLIDRFEEKAWRRLGPKDQFDCYTHDQMQAFGALAVADRLLTKLTARASAEPIYRMSSSDIHRRYNQARRRGSLTPGSMARPPAVLDLSLPRIVSIPVGPPVLTGRNMPPHWRGETVRTYKSNRYVNMQGKSKIVRGYGVNGGQPPDVAKTAVKGLI